MTYRVVTRVVLSLALAFLSGGCRQEPARNATLTPDANIRSLVEGDRSAQPPEARAATVIDIQAAQTETTSPDKHTYTVDPSIEYKELSIRLKPYSQLKGKILNSPNSAK